MCFWIKYTAQKMKFYIKNFFSKCDQIRRKLRIWSHLLNKFLMENFIFCAVIISNLIKRLRKKLSEKWQIWQRRIPQVLRNQNNYIKNFLNLFSEFIFRYFYVIVSYWAVFNKYGIPGSYLMHLISRVSQDLF